MSKKGVSAEEKRNRMLQIFHETGDCFQLKELEKIAPKDKGIVANSVKDVLQQLVDDGLVDTDKIGTSVYYWSFPSKFLTIRKKRLKDLKNEMEETTKKIQLVNETLDASEGNEDDEEKCKQVLEEINRKTPELQSLKMQLKHFLENDPKKFEEIINKTQELKEAANRWTENIFAIKSWCKKKFMLEDSVINKQFGLPEDFDYVQ